MYVVIAGCGRVGSGVARTLIEEGHDVAIIDEDADAFELLGDDFPGQFIVGAALDWDVMRRAGIEGADAFMACTDGDNTNITCAQIAQKGFEVRCVVARVFDSARAELFKATGINTVCPTKDTRTMLVEAVRVCQLEGQGR
jgi:trk system potassium uptake protein TrkA